MSPRVSFALQCQGEMNHDTLGDWGVMSEMGFEWLEWNDHHLEHLDPGVKSNMKTNKSLRQGFANIFGYVAQAITAKKVPTAENVLEYAEGEWPPCTRNYLQRGGTVAAVVLACFDAAINQDQYLGDGEHQTPFQEDFIDKLPTCRDDGEFVFASRMYRAMEGLPADNDVEVERRRFWLSANECIVMGVPD